MTNNTSLNSITLPIVLAMICFSLGCEQTRYNASGWAPATGGNGTLPGVGQLGDGSSNSLPSRSDTLPGRVNGRTLPNRNGSSLPMRAGNQTSLPSRAGGTLPSRQRVVVSRPKKKEKPPLPSLEGKPVWDVREKQEMPRVRGKLGLYMGEGGVIGLPMDNPQRGSGSTLPSRGATTLPSRGSGFGSSTLPSRY